MGAATAFRSCEAAGAPMPAFYRAVLLMRRELLKWASAPFSTSGRAASLDAARGAALCAQLCQTHPVAPERRDAGDRAIFRRLQRPVQQALQALLGAWRPPVFRQRHLQTSPNLAERQEVLRLVAAIDEGFGRELLAELRIVAATQASLPWIKRALVALTFALRSFGGADGRKRLPEAPSSPLGSVWLEGDLRGRAFEVSFPGQLEARGIPTSMRELAGRAARVQLFNLQSQPQANCLRCNQEAAMLLFRAQSMALAARRAPIRMMVPRLPPSQALFGMPVRCFSEKVTGGHPEFQDKTMNEAARARQPRAPILIVSAMCVVLMFWWAPALFSAVALGSVLGEDSTHKAFAVGGQSERGDTKREQMKREYAERQAREQANK
ncbi:unnamed protein product [Symbiodinium microadriaticum]|nr:unnamed protein product [Symbiodinium microadriaticum]